MIYTLVTPLRLDRPNIATLVRRIIQRLQICPGRRTLPFIEPVVDLRWLNFFEILSHVSCFNNL